MWRPPERIKHALPDPEWPTREDADKARWFQPVQLGPVTLAERSWVPAMVPWRATEEGYVTPDVLEWYARFAEGRPGAIVVEATGVRDIRSGNLMRIGDDRFIPGLQDLVRVVEEASGGHTKLFIQIIDFLAIRRRPDREKYLRRYMVIDERIRARVSGDDDAIREAMVAMPDEELQSVLNVRQWESLQFGYRERVTDVALPHVEELPRVLPEYFGAAAERAEKAGFHGVELHYAHAYTMSSFLSATNTRKDGYGTTREGRIRLPLEVLASVKSRVSSDFAVGCRYLSEESIEGGSNLSDAVYFGVEFARAGMDFLSLSRGGKFDDALQPKVGAAVYPYTGPSGYECMPTAISDEEGPFGRNIQPTATIRNAIREAGFQTPIVVAGGICSFEQVEEILSRGEADVVGAARQALADPDWTLKTRLGRGDEVRRCQYTNYCEALDQTHKQVTCRLWDRKGRDEPGISLSFDGKRRLLAPSWTEGPRLDQEN